MLKKIDIKKIPSKKKLIKGTPLMNNAGIQKNYINKLTGLVDLMSKDLEKGIRSIISGDAAKGFASDASLTSEIRIFINKISRKYDRVFSEKAKLYVDYLINSEKNNSKRNLGSSLRELSGGVSIDVDSISPKLKEMIKAASLENSDLIKSIKVDYFDSVKGDILRSIITSEESGLKGLQDKINSALTSRYKQYKNKAKNIALDQTRKVYGTVNAERMKSANIKKFEWLHTGGGQRPDPDHVAMSGKIYSFDDLPVIDKRTGERGIPSQRVGCTCTMIPVIEFDED